MCYVEQGHYGHPSRKPTWLLAAGVSLAGAAGAELDQGEQRLPQWMVDHYGYEKARAHRRGGDGGQARTRPRSATPRLNPFRDLLL